MNKVLILQSLSMEEDYKSRVKAASSPYITEQIMKNLSLDTNQNVLKALLENERVSSDIKRKLSEVLSIDYIEELRKEEIVEEVLIEAKPDYTKKCEDFNKELKLYHESEESVRVLQSRYDVLINELENVEKEISIYGSDDRKEIMLNLYESGAEFQYPHQDEDYQAEYFSLGQQKKEMETASVYRIKVEGYEERISAENIEQAVKNIKELLNPQQQTASELLKRYS